MSFSFTVTGKKDTIRKKVATELDAIIASQPVHARDREAALSTTMAYVDLVTAPEGKELKVSVSGSVGWSGHGDQSTIELNGAGVNVSVSLI